MRLDPRRARSALLAVVAPLATLALAHAQAWSPPVEIGRTSEGRPSLSMAANG